MSRDIAVKKSQRSVVGWKEKSIPRGLDRGNEEGDQKINYVDQLGHHRTSTGLAKILNVSRAPAG